MSPGMAPRQAPVSAEGLLRQTLTTSANPGGGWGYYPSKTSRLEPTVWAIAALGASDPTNGARTSGIHFLSTIARPDGWLLEDPSWPVNIGFNGAAAFLGLADPALVPDDVRLIDTLVGSKGVKAPQNETSPQDNSLQGWSWTDGTFSWVEPTAWGLLALKRAARLGHGGAEVDARIAEGHRVLVDRCCRNGGWNFGNASTMQTDLRPYVPTSALALLALQDRPDDPAVVRSLAFLDAHWGDETSALALGLSLICLDVYGQPVDEITSRLRDHIDATRAFGNLHGMAVALLALTPAERTRVFRL